MYAFQEMKRIITAAVLIPLVLVLVLKGHFWLLTAAAAVVAMAAAWEFMAWAGHLRCRAAFVSGVRLSFAAGSRVARHRVVTLLPGVHRIYAIHAPPDR